MGRKNKSYSKDLHQQAYEKLTSMLALGESKREAVLNGTADDKIFSVNTYKTYWKHIKYFLKYVKEKYPECTTLKKAKRYVNEWLQVRVDQDLSAWTIQAEAKALGKLYGINQTMKTTSSRRSGTDQKLNGAGETPSGIGTSRKLTTMS